MRNIRYRVVLPICLGGLSTALMAWDIHYGAVSASMGIDRGDSPSILTRIFLAINLPAYGLAEPIHHGQLWTYPALIMTMPVIVAWWWVGTRIDFGILGGGRYRHTKLTAWILITLAVGLLLVAVQAGIAEGLSVAALIGAKQLYSN